MRARQPHLPAIWLVTDARNDDALERIIARLPRGSGVIFRHYHLSGRERQARFEAAARAARRRGHVVVVARPERGWRADGVYRAADFPGLAFTRGLLLLTAHSLREIAAAHRARADAIVLSPVFPTRSHPGAPTLGPVRFRLLAARARVPVIALGGMTARRARSLGAPRWAAIDGLFLSTRTVAELKPLDS